MKKRKNKTLRIAIAVLGILFCISAVKIGNYFWDAHKSDQFTAELQELVMQQTEENVAEAQSETEKADDDTAAENIAVPVSIPEQIDFAPLQQISGDVKAWIFSPNTRINNVIAQAQDNEYYLHRLLNGTETKAGTLFLDYHNQGDFSDWNTIIYGHHMKNESMFASLVTYRRQDYSDEHPVMYLYLPGHRYRLDLIAGYTTGTEDQIYTIPGTASEKQQLAEYAMQRSDFSTTANVETEDRLVTLSTCSYSYDDARYVIAAKITEEK